MTDEQFRSLCNVYGFAPSRSLRELLDTAISQSVLAERLACAALVDANVAACRKPLPAEPVQEPVAWIHTDPDKRRVKFLEWRENEPGYRGDWIKTPLYAAPPQRKPLTEEEISNIWDGHVVPVFGKNGINPIVFARAIEAKHGIGGQQ